MWVLADDPVIGAIAPAIVALCAFVVAQALWPRPTTVSRPLLLIVSVALMGQYVWWRASATLPPPALNFECTVAIVFFSAETAGMFAASLSFLFLARRRDRSADADADRDWLDRLAAPPLVDVLICSYNEERQIIERTIIGALAMDYPNFRVWMLDDGRRDWVKALCTGLGCRYVTRPDNRHAKAGNINNGLSILSQLADLPEYVCVLDADFVPKPQFLKRAMALFCDPSVGIVQTPQHFVNPDPIQINLGATKFWPDEQRFFFDVVLPAKDAWSAAFCCGTSSIIRFRPLMAIGGFPTDSVTEDYLVSLRLKETGLTTAYLNEPLTYGLAPEGLKEYVTQRSRWCLGFMQIARGRSGPFSRTTRLKLIDRIALLETFLNWTAVNISRAVGLMIPTIALAFNIHPFRTTTYDLAVHFLPYFVWNSLAMHWLSGGRVVPILFDVGQLLAMPQNLKAVAVGLWRPQGHKFKVTAKGGDRARGFIEWTLMRPFGIMLALSALTVLYVFDFSGRPETIRESGPALAWIWYNLVILVLVCFVCIEQPRHRASERYSSRDLIRITTADGERLGQLADLSITGARIRGPSPAARGQRIAFELSGQRIEATVVRVDRDGFAVAFAHTLETRIAMIRHFYGGGYLKPLDQVAVLKVGAAIVRRVLS